MEETVFTMPTQIKREKGPCQLKRGKIHTWAHFPSWSTTLADKGSHTEAEQGERERKREWTKERKKQASKRRREEEEEEEKLEEWENVGEFSYSSVSGTNVFQEWEPSLRGTDRIEGNGREREGKRGRARRICLTSCSIHGSNGTKAEKARQNSFQKVPRVSFPIFWFRVCSNEKM